MLDQWISHSESYWFMSCQVLIFLLELNLSTDQRICCILSDVKSGLTAHVLPFGFLGNVASIIPLEGCPSTETKYLCFLSVIRILFIFI